MVPFSSLPLPRQVDPPLGRCFGSFFFSQVDDDGSTPWLSLQRPFSYLPLGLPRSFDFLGPIFVEVVGLPLPLPCDRSFPFFFPCAMGWTRCFPLPLQSSFVSMVPLFSFQRLSTSGFLMAGGGVTTFLARRFWGPFFLDTVDPLFLWWYAMGAGPPFFFPVTSYLYYADGPPLPSNDPARLPFPSFPHGSSSSNVGSFLSLFFPEGWIVAALFFTQRTVTFFFHTLEYGTWPLPPLPVSAVFRRRASDSFCSSHWPGPPFPYFSWLSPIPFGPDSLSHQKNRAICFPPRRGLSFPTSRGHSPWPAPPFTTPPFPPLPGVFPFFSSNGETFFSFLRGSIDFPPPTAVPRPPSFFFPRRGRAGRPGSPLRSSFPPAKRPTFFFVDIKLFFRSQLFFRPPVRTLPSPPWPTRQTVFFFFFFPGPAAKIFFVAIGVPFFCRLPTPSPRGRKNAHLFPWRREPISLSLNLQSLSFSLCFAGAFPFSRFFFISSAIR